MHSYLRAIGFSDIAGKKELEGLMAQVLNSPTEQKMARMEGEQFLVEYSRDFSDSMGIAVRGECGKGEDFEMDYYFPYFRGKGVTSHEEVDVEKHAEKESYAGVCDDVKVGVTLIFYLQNVTEYLDQFEREQLPCTATEPSITLSGLSLSGKILFPIGKDEAQIENTKQYSNNRNHLIAAARQGDEEAIESLTLEDIDIYSVISRRILNEDVLSLVDSFFMPFGVESDQYSLMGEILDMISTKNSITQEEIYIMTINCNELIFDICINKQDLLGEPAVGRRFKGTVWLQGRINYPD